MDLGAASASENSFLVFGMDSLFHRLPPFVIQALQINTKMSINQTKKVRGSQLSGYKGESLVVCHCKQRNDDPILTFMADIASLRSQWRPFPTGYLDAYRGSYQSAKTVEQSFLEIFYRFMKSRNSLLESACIILSSRNSIASTEFMSARSFRNSQIL